MKKRNKGLGADAGATMPAIVPEVVPADIELRNETGITIPPLDSGKPGLPLWIYAIGAVALLLLSDELDFTFERKGD
jgi:hypothetical protein